VTAVARSLRTVAIALVTVLVAAGPAAAARHAPNPKANPNAGIVNIYTTLGYQNASAAGTGMIVDASGEVLTNNHVIRGATTFRVVEVSTKRTFTATVVGYSVSQDVAVLQIKPAKNLPTIKRGNSSKLKLSQPVVARGNAGGRGGATVAKGVITGLHKQIVARDDQGGSETLTNLIETNAGIEPGDSGGPLFNAAGRAIGMITAGTTSFQFQGVASRGYAIPINKAMGIVRLIEKGVSTDGVHVGPTAFLGVSIQDVLGGVQIRAVVGGSAAEGAGLQPGDVITSLNGTPVTSSDDLQKIVLSLVPGTTLPIEWTDATGAAQTAQIAPAAGPPQ
jgi:S1-C subfamily serine protease